MGLSGLEFKSYGLKVFGCGGFQASRSTPCPPPIITKVQSCASSVRGGGEDAMYLCEGG